MPIPPGLLLQTVSILRRTSQGVDPLNNPIYGQPTSGVGWTTVYSNIQVRLAFSTDMIKFAKEGERVLPGGVMYINPGPVILQEDRVIVNQGPNQIEYLVKSVVQGFIGGTLDHWEMVLDLV